MSDEDVRLEIYQRFAASGSPPLAALLAEHFHRPAEEIHAAFDRLAAARHIVLASDGSRSIIMAHPFSAVPLGFSVMGRRTLYWGGCAWDSFALPHLLPEDDSVLVATRCPHCDRALAWVVNRSAPPTGTEVAHFLTPTADMWRDVVHTCGNQRIYCSAACVDAWLAARGLRRGYVMDLATLWRLASQWYGGRMERGYVRREPAAAKAYFASVGLRGAFWGLPE